MTACEKLATWENQQIDGETWTVTLYKDPSKGGRKFFIMDRANGQEMLFELTGGTKPDSP